MNYLFTIAGMGSRFIKDGIKPPKPLIKVHGEELLIWSMKSFNIIKGDKIYIASQKNHKCKKVLSKKLEILYFGVKISWFEIDYLPNGQLLTAIKAIEALKISGELIIHNCDTSFNSDFNFNNYFKENKDIYALIPTFKSEGNHWSFIKNYSSSKKIKQIKEKKRISSNCSIGTYFFRSSQEFCKDGLVYAHSFSPNSELQEYYIAPFLDYLLSQGKNMENLDIKEVKVFGTPEELFKSLNINQNSLISENAWSGNQRKTLIVDIDGTICEPPLKGDYSKCKPIKSVIKKLLHENEKGTYIVLFTARNMRTFNGNLGLINKHTAPILINWLTKNKIPYDELIFGKPWGNGGVRYLDDKSLDPKTFISG